MLFYERHFILFFLALLTLYWCLPWHGLPSRRLAQRASALQGLVRYVSAAERAAAAITCGASSSTRCPYRCADWAIPPSWYPR